jgi:CheY-like chemotaxis protein
MTILIVDDDQDQLSTRKMLLEHSGFQVVAAENETQARRLATEHRPDCVLMDLNLPTLKEGLGLIRDLKAENHELHVLILTGSDPKILMGRPESALVDAVFRKPARSGALIEKLRAYA